jgi:hypothetical protein
MAQQPLPTAEPTATEVLVRDPLSPVTRKERFYLLAVSMIRIAMVRTGLVPTKIATFGIELDKPNRSALLFLLALVTIYFFVAFVVYAASDYIARREALSAVRKRDIESARHEVIARRLNTSVENIRRQYLEGALEDSVRRIYSREYQEFLHEAGDDYSPTTHEDVRRDLEDIERDVNDRMAFLEGRSAKPPRAAANSLESPEGSGGTGLIGLTRVFFEFLLPLLVGIYAIYSLLSRAFG